MSEVTPTSVDTNTDTNTKSTYRSLSAQRLSERTVVVRRPKLFYANATESISTLSLLSLAERSNKNMYEPYGKPVTSVGLSAGPSKNVGSIHHRVRYFVLF
jgi:hypothetical protein